MKRESNIFYTYQYTLLFLIGNNPFMGEGKVAPSPTQSSVNKTVPRIPSIHIEVSASDRT